MVSELRHPPSPSGRQQKQQQQQQQQQHFVVFDYRPLQRRRQGHRDQSRTTGLVLSAPAQEQKNHGIPGRDQATPGHCDALAVHRQGGLFAGTRVQRQRCLRETPSPAECLRDRHRRTVLFRHREAPGNPHRPGRGRVLADDPRHRNRNDGGGHCLQPGNDRPIGIQAVHEPARAGSGRIQRRHGGPGRRQGYHWQVRGGLLLGLYGGRLRFRHLPAGDHLGRGQQQPRVVVDLGGDRELRAGRGGRDRRLPAVRPGHDRQALSQGGLLGPPVGKQGQGHSQQVLQLCPVPHLRQRRPRQHGRGRLGPGSPRGRRGDLLGVLQVRRQRH
mmetsp:Transcript_29322/g.79375  ORF Transcript_29322/g.79375 Transcript_29322/m.79375 type:complete len:329 (-) Transcript_29322:2587-3573(-)